MTKKRDSETGGAPADLLSEPSTQGSGLVPAVSDVGKPAALVTTDAPPTVADMLRLAIETGIGAEGIERLAKLHERSQDRDAERAFNDALMDFQAECPVITKTKAVKDKQGKHRYSFAPYAQVVRTIRPFMKKHGFSHREDSPEPPDENGYMKVGVIISHVGGHKEHATFPVKVDKDAYMSDPQKVASAVSFGRRYALILGLGLTTDDTDDDGERAGAKTLNEEQSANLTALLDETKADLPKFLAFFHVKKLSDISDKDYPKAVRMLEAKRSQG